MTFGGPTIVKARQEMMAACLENLAALDAYFARLQEQLEAELAAGQEGGGEWGAPVLDAEAAVAAQIERTEQAIHRFHTAVSVAGAVRG